MFPKSRTISDLLALEFVRLLFSRSTDSRVCFNVIWDLKHRALELGVATIFRDNYWRRQNDELEINLWNYNRNKTLIMDGDILNEIF